MKSFNTIVQKSILLLCIALCFSGNVTLAQCTTPINLSLNGGPDSIRVLPGASIDVTGTFDVSNSTSCPTCIRQLVLGIEGDAIDCLYDGIPAVCPSVTPGTISGVSFTAPTTPGEYTLYFNETLQFNCVLSAYTGSAGRAIGKVVVTNCPSQVNLSLNGGGDSISVEPGTLIDVTGNYEVSNFTSCPTCIRQIVLGIEGSAIDCLYDGIPAVCPSSTTGSISGVSFIAPAAPGIYRLYYNQTLQFSCDTSTYSGQGGRLVGTVRVTNCSSQVNLSLNGGGDSIAVEPGANIDVTGTFDVSNFTSCPSCIRQLVLGIEDDPIDCIYDAIPQVCPNVTSDSIRGVSFIAPTTPGLYNLYYNPTLQFSCNLPSYTGSAGTLIGKVKVFDCETTVNLSLNGGGDSIGVSPGANIDVTGDFKVFNYASCPSCIRQLVFGIEDEAIGCLYDAIPEVCPNATTDSIRGVSFTAPTTPGTYKLYYNETLQFNCVLNEYKGSTGREIGTVTVDSTQTNVESELAFKRVLIYPNPSESGLLNLSFQHDKPNQLSIGVFDLRGKQVFDQEVEGKIGEQTLNLNLAYLEPGVYLVQLSDGTHISHHRVILK